MMFRSPLATLVVAFLFASTTTGCPKTGNVKVGQIDCGPNIFGQISAGKIEACAEADARVGDTRSRGLTTAAAAITTAAGNPSSIRQAANGDQTMVANQSAYPPVMVVTGYGYSSGNVAWSGYNQPGAVPAYGGYGCPPGFLVTAGGCTAVGQAYADASATQAALGEIRTLREEVSDQGHVLGIMVDATMGRSPP